MANTWINYIPATLVRDAKTQDGSKSFKSVSVPCAESANGFASITVSNGQVMESKTKAGVVNDKFRNILLGKPDATRKVSVKLADGTYQTIEMTNEALAAAFQASRTAYKAAVATEAAAE